MAKEAPVAARTATGVPDRSPDVLEALNRRVVVERIEPEIDGGRFPIKRTVGESVDVSATIFSDGHDVITAMLRDRPTTSRVELATNSVRPAHAAVRSADPDLRDDWRETPMAMVAPGTDRWTARFVVTEIGWHEYQIVAWVDRFLTWRRDVRIKANAGQDIAIELIEGAVLIRNAAARATERDAAWLLERADTFTETTPQPVRIAAALDDDLAALMVRYA